MGWRSKGWGPGNENQYGVRRTQFPLRFAPPARVRARRSRPAPCLEGGLTYRPGLDRGQHSLSDTAIRKREGERVDPGPLAPRAEPVRESLVREGVRANLLAGVTPSEAAIVDAAAARGWSRSCGRSGGTSMRCARRRNLLCELGAAALLAS